MGWIFSTYGLEEISNQGFGRKIEGKRLLVSPENRREGNII